MTILSYFINLFYIIVLIKFLFIVELFNSRFLLSNLKYSLPCFSILFMLFMLISILQSFSIFKVFIEDEAFLLLFLQLIINVVRVDFEQSWSVILLLIDLIRAVYANIFSSNLINIDNSSCWWLMVVIGLN